MEQRATVFVEAMAVVAIVGVLAFLIGLLVGAPQQLQAGGARQPTQSPRWYEFTLALVLLAAIAALAIWIISSGRHWVWGETISDWRSDTHAIVFAAVMVALGIVGLAVSLAYTLVQSGQRAAQPPPEAAVEAMPASAGVAPTRSALSILGLLVLALAVLLLCWIDLAAAEQYGLLVQLIYPGGLGLALVLLLDKATRAWGTKRGAETVREWFLCDLLVFLFVLAFLNLRSVPKPEAYAGTFWDVLNIVLFFVAFWTLDRTSSRSRFLVGYGYLIILPLLLLIWQVVQGTAAPYSWWASVWPFLILAVGFFILEVITLVSSMDEEQTLSAIKDALFVVLYAVLLIIAMKARG